MENFFNAIIEGKSEDLELMLETTPDLILSKTPNGLSGVMVAIYYRKTEIVGILIEKGAFLSIFEASSLGRVDLVLEYLKQDQSLVNMFSSDGFTPLHLASFFGQDETVRILLDHGADPNITSKNEQNVTPLHSSVAADNFNITEMLVNSGVEVNRTQKGGFTPLHEAALNGNYELVQLLLEHGANMNAKNDAGKTSLDLALSKTNNKNLAEKRKKVLVVLGECGKQNN